jgi:ADP-ribosylglycohydrolase
VNFPHRNQFAGCLIGQCLGDALGFVVEGMPADVCREYVEKELRVADGPVKIGDHTVGQYTDDSQLARELLLSCVERHRFDPSDYARRIACLFKEDRVVGRGLATHQAAQRLIDGTPWEDSGARAPSAGNGAAMRAGPIGLLYSDVHDKRNTAAVMQGWITHQDPRSSAGSITIAGSVALALHEDEIIPEQFVGPLADWSRPYDPLLADALEEMPDRLREEPAEAVKSIAKVGLGPSFRGGWVNISPFVTTSVLWSVYSFLRSPDDYWESICTAIEVGGDVDTTGAMTGAISGARVGLEGLPVELASHVHDQETWKYEELIELAYRCHEMRLAGSRAAVGA